MVGKLLCTRICVTIGCYCSAWWKWRRRATFSSWRTVS